MGKIRGYPMALLSSVNPADISMVAPAARRRLPDTPKQPYRAALSAIRPSESEQRLGMAVVAVSVLAFVVCIPFAQTKLLPVAAFIPAYEAALIIIDLITAVLLLGQFVQMRSRPVLILAAGYLFDALIIIPHALTFPGLFAPTGLLGAGSQSTAWLYMFWHGGFAIFVIGYAALQNGTTKLASSQTANSEPLIWFLGVVGAVCFITILTTTGQTLLPTIMDGPGYTPVMKLVVTTVWALSLVAFIFLWRRRSRSVLDLWLMVVMCAWMCDIALSAVLNAGRFDLGFYAGRLYGLMAASFVLIVLTLEMSGLHGRLAKVTTQLAQRAMKLEEDVRQSVTDHRQIEAQLRQAQKMEAIGNLTGGMAHDFNNLLGVVIGNLDMLRDRKKSDAEVLELAGDALDAALRGADLTRRLLAFARRQPLQPKRIDLNILIESITRLLSRTLGENIEISLDLGPRLSPVVADPAQLEAALTNLATNARDAMPDGGKLIIATRNRYLDADYASQHPEVVAGDHALIEVSDNGCGIPTEMLTRVFEPFFTTKDQGKGTGLGLSMVYGFMKQSGGHINVYSEVGMGTTFRLYFPRAQAGSEADPPQQVGETINGRGETVLAVEDNLPLRRIAVRQLRELGYRVLEADNATAALEVLENEKADVLFTDIVMPGGITGFQLARSAQERWPNLRVVFTSGFPDVKLGSDGMPSADALLLSKPYRKQDLAKALREVLG
jgi:signal transduction histidine kinase